MAFKRYGLQPDGTTLAEPKGLEKADLADADWRAVDLPHDYAIEGPFRIDLEGATGKIVVRAESNGLKPASIELQSK